MDVMKRFPLVIAACIALLGCAGQARAAEEAVRASSGIGSVWNAQASCDGFSSLAKSRHPDEATIRATGRVDLPGSGFTFNYAELDGMDETVLLLAFDDRSRGVVDHYVLFAPDDISPPMAAIVITKLPPDLQKDPRSTVISVAAQQLGNARHLMSAPIMFRHLLGNGPNPAIEMMVPGRKGSFCFPTSRFLIDLEAPEPTFGLSWFLFDAPYLFELSLVVPEGEAHLVEDQIELARAQLLRLSRSIHPTEDLPPG